MLKNSRLIGKDIIHLFSDKDETKTKRIATMTAISCAQIYKHTLKLNTIRLQFMNFWEFGCAPPTTTIK